MAGIDEVLERLVAEPEFRAQLRSDPAAALSGYVLYDEDLEVLAATLDESEGGDHDVEQRTSKSTLLGLVVGFSGAGGSAGASPETGWDIQANEEADPLGDEMRAEGEATSKKKGNVEYEWKVEEGESAPPVQDKMRTNEPIQTEETWQWEDGELVAIDSVESFLDAPPPADDDVLASDPEGQATQSGERDVPGAADESREQEPEAEPDDRPDGPDDEPRPDSGPGPDDEPPRDSDPGPDDEPPRDAEPGRDDEPPRGDDPDRDDDRGPSWDTTDDEPGPAGEPEDGPRDGPPDLTQTPRSTPPTPGIEGSDIGTSAA